MKFKTSYSFILKHIFIIIYSNIYIASKTAINSVCSKTQSIFSFVTEKYRLHDRSVLSDERKLFLHSQFPKQYCTCIERSLIWQLFIGSSVERSWSFVELTKYLRIPTTHLAFLINKISSSEFNSSLFVNRFITSPIFLSPVIPDQSYTRHTSYTLEQSSLLYLAID